MVERAEWLEPSGLLPVEHAMMDVVPFIVVRGGRISHVNQAALVALAYEPGDQTLLGSQADLLVDPADRLQLRRELRYPTQARRATGRTRQFLSRQGRRILVATLSVRMLWEGHKSVGLAFVVIRQPTESGVVRCASTLEGSGSCPKIALLSPRQAEIARLLSHGYSPVNVAAQLNLSVETARTHIKAIYQKTGVRCRVALARLVLGADSSSSTRR